jgi:hypothetical protein
MKKLITLLLLFTLVGFLSGNQVVITNDYEYIVSTGKTYNFNNGNPSNNIKYDRTNKIQIQNNKVIANPLKYHYAFFWNEADAFIGYYKTNKGIATNGAYLGQVNTQSIPLPLNAYSFALVRYDNDYVLVNGYTIEELFIDNNLAGVDPADFNDIPIAELNGLTLNEVFDDRKLTGTFNSGTTIGNIHSTTITDNPLNLRFDTSLPAINNVFIYAYARLRYTNASSTFINFTLNGTTSGSTLQVGIQDPAVSNQFYVLSGIVNPTNHVGNIQHRFNVVGGDATKTIEVDMNFGINYINLTALGIASLTKAQLDTYFSIYQNGVNATYYATDGNVSTVDGNYFAAGKNLIETLNFDVWTLVGTPTQPLQIVDNELIFTPINNQNFYFQNLNLIDGQSYSISAFAMSETTSLVRGAIINIRDINDNLILTLDFNNGLSNVYEYKSGTFTYQSGYIIKLSNRNSSFSGGQLKFKEIQLEQGSTATTFEAFATPTTTLNLTFLFGIGNEPDKATMDGYYAEYEEYLEYLYVCCNIFATQTISFETIYFDDGVSTEIERLGSILIFTLIGFTLMIFGFASKRRIFNLLAVGAFVVLGFLLIEFVGFIIILFGLIFVNVYYTFFGEL